MAAGLLGLSTRLPLAGFARRRFDRLGPRRGIAQRGELGLQRLKTAVRRIEAFERGAGVGGVGEFAQDIGRRRRVVAVIDFNQHAGRRDAAGREMPGITERRIAEREVGVGQRLVLVAAPKAGT